MTIVETIEARLVEALQPIRQYVLATCIYHSFESGLFETLAGADGQSIEELAGRLGFDEHRLGTLLQFLVNEGLVSRTGERFGLTPKGHSLSDFRAWYTMMIGGYGRGNGLYLVEFCKALPDLQAWGAEPYPAGYDAAVALVQREQMEHRIHLSCSGAREFFRTAREFTPDMTVFGLVLHEILGQEGKKSVQAFLRELIERYPDIYLIVIEVDFQMENPGLMRYELALAYYNAYYLLHPFTSQRLASRSFWSALFTRAGLDTDDGRRRARRGFHRSRVRVPAPARGGQLSTLAPGRWLGMTGPNTGATAPRGWA